MKTASSPSPIKVIDYDLPVFEPGIIPEYIVLESISSNTSKVIHVINFIATQEIKIGRGHDTDVRVTDISVSRLHAFIKKSKNGRYYF